MASFTRKAIIALFLKLLNQRPLNQITIKDIVEDCGINRNSFYYHFEDLPDLVETVIQEEADRIIAEHAAVSSLEECLDIALDFALNNKKAVLHLHNSSSHDTYELFLSRICAHVLEEYVDTVLPDLPVQPEDKKLLIHFYKCECVGQITDWLNAGMKYDIKGQFHRLCRLFEGSAQTAFRRSAGLEPFADSDK